MYAREIYNLFNVYNDYVKKFDNIYKASDSSQGYKYAKRKYKKL